MKFYDIEQNSDEWFDLRAGKLTGSAFSKIMANFGKAFGEPAKNIAMNLAVERITGRPTDSGSFTNSHMERGHDQEPVARMLYEDTTFSSVTNGGFFCHNDVGCSPDGLVDDDGVIEIKSVVASTHFKNVSRGSFDPAYKWQLVGNLHYTGREYIDFISYCADYPSSKRLYICTISKDKVRCEIEQLLFRVDQFQGLINSNIELILNSDYEVTYEQV